MKTTTELNGKKYILDSETDVIIDLANGQLVEPSEFKRLQERARKASSWTLITESEPFPSEIVKEDSELITIWNSYLISETLYKYETQLLLQKGEVIALKYNEEKGQEHYQVFTEMDNTLLSIVNSYDDVVDGVQSREDLLSKIVATIWENYTEIADDKPSFMNDVKKEVIYYDNNLERYRLRELDGLKANPERVKRTKLK